MTLLDSAAVTDDSTVLPTHEDEPHAEASDARLNWLRAAVLGANDGIVSVAAIVVGVRPLEVRPGVSVSPDRPRL